MASPDDYLLMSGIQHFSFLPPSVGAHTPGTTMVRKPTHRRSRLQHTRCHDVTLTEKRGDLLIARGMRVVSHRLKLTGDCDVAEFHKDPNGVSLQGPPRPVAAHARGI